MCEEIDLTFEAGNRLEVSMGGFRIPKAMKAFFSGWAGRLKLFLSPAQFWVVYIYWFVFYFFTLASGCLISDIHNYAINHDRSCYFLLREYGEDTKYLVVFGLGLRALYLFRKKRNAVAKICLAHIFIIFVFSCLIDAFVDAWAWAHH